MNGSPFRDSSMVVENEREDTFQGRLTALDSGHPSEQISTICTEEKEEKGRKVRGRAQESTMLPLTAIEFQSNSFSKYTSFQTICPSLEQFNFPDYGEFKLGA